MTRSSCNYQGSGTTGLIALTTFEDTATAAAHLKTYRDATVAAGGTAQAADLDGTAAWLITPAKGSGQIFVLRENVLLGAAVLAHKKGVAAGLDDRSRELAVAALGKM